MSDERSWIKYKHCIICRYSNGTANKHGTFHDECYEQWLEASELLRQRYGYWNDERKAEFLAKRPTVDDYNPMRNVGYGWWGILTNLTLVLEKIAPGFAVHQIKEKFGGLRYYTTALPNLGHTLVSWAENQSERTCEICGDYGELRTVGWWKTSCDYHYQPPKES